MPGSSRNVVITGLGPVTSIGMGCDALWASLAAGRTNVANRTLTVDLGKTVELPMAGMPPVESIAGLDRHFAYLAEQGCEGYRDLAYALHAVDFALHDARLDAHGGHFTRSRNNVGMVQAFEAPGVERTSTRLFQLFSHGPPRDGPPPVYDLLAPSFYNMQAFLYVHVVAKAFGLRGFCTSVHNACTSGAFAIEVAAQQIRAGQADVMVVVGAEAFETAVRLEWFRRLDLYARSGDTMRPFSTDSTGFYVGEGAAAMVLESADHAALRGAAPYAAYLGGAFAHQAWKQTIPDVRSAMLRDVIVEALSRTETDAASIDLIVPHGASTQLSDGYEAACLREALGGKARGAVAAVYKPSVGHMLAASGIVETLCALLAMKNQSVPATLNAAKSESSLPVPLVNKPIDRRVDTILKLSTGFTGHDAALIFRRP
jgi:3-oxoacyl-(acyl-carrier-protein) synthase